MRMGKTKKSLPTYMKQAGYGKEVGSFLLDAAAALAIGLTLRFTLGTYVIAPAAGYDDAKVEYYALANQAGLYHEESGTLQAYSFTDTGEDLYNHYYEMNAKVWNYYYVVCGQTNGDTKFVLTGFEAKTQKGTEEYKQEVGKYIYNNIYVISTEDSKSNTYYTYPMMEDGTTPDYSKAPILKEAYATRILDTNPSADDRIAAKKDLYVYVMGDSDSSTVGTYTNACYDFVSQPEPLVYNAIGSRAIYLARIPAVMVPTFIFFFLLPLVLKRGKTLGKLAFKMSVVGKDGYKAKKVNVVLHAFLVMLPFELLLLPLSTYLNYIILFAYFLLDYIVLLVTKRHQAIHDMISGTIVIDDKASLAIFDSYQEEQDYARDHDDELASEIRRTTASEPDPTYVNGRKTVVTQPAPAPEVFDASMIGAARKEAAAMTSFDEYEAKKNAETANAETSANHDVKAKASADAEADPEVEDLMAMDGALPEKPKPEEQKEEKPAEEPAEPEDPQDDDFVDEKK